MATQKQIRQTFTRNWQVGSPSGERAWLIKGDFDHFRRTNDLYGPLITDYLLDWTLEVIEAELRADQSRMGCEELLCNFVGDDMTIYLPPSSRQEEDIIQLLWKIRGAIVKSFSHRYLVGAVPLPAEFFEDVPPEGLERIRNDLESRDIVIDFARRERGYLVLLPVADDGDYRKVFNGMLRMIQRGAGKAAPMVDLHLDWIFDPDERAFYALNGGFIEAQLVSFAACPVEMGIQESQVQSDVGLVYDRVSLACESALKKCKQQRKGVVLCKDYPDSLEAPPSSPAAGIPALDSPLRWSSERYLRESFYFRQLDQPVLFQFNPVYLPACGIPAAMMTGDIDKIEKYRGNQYGIGLKGINELFGQRAGDRLIGQLTDIFSSVMQGALVVKGITPERVHMARFVDRFTVCCELPIFQLAEIVELIRSVAAFFNSISPDIKISHLRTSVITGDPLSIGFRLFQQLTLTNLSPRSYLLESSQPLIEVRQNYPTSALREGITALERRSFLSARLLASAKGAMPEQAVLRNPVGLPVESSGV